jgi:hypothetical protein
MLIGNHQRLDATPNTTMTVAGNGCKLPSTINIRIE